jgi:hypothetical protein
MEEFSPPDVTQKYLNLATIYVIKANAILVSKSAIK